MSQPARRFAQWTESLPSEAADGKLDCATVIGIFRPGVLNPNFCAYSAMVGAPTLSATKP